MVKQISSTSAANPQAPQPLAFALQGKTSSWRSRAASTDVLCRERRGLGLGRVLVFGIQGWITLFIGGLLALITLFSS
jgi:hypothetical protein